MATSQPRRSGAALALLAVRFPTWKMIRLVARQATTSDVVHLEGAWWQDRRRPQTLSTWRVHSFFLKLIHSYSPTSNSAQGEVLQTEFPLWLSSSAPKSCP